MTHVDPDLEPHLVRQVLLDTVPRRNQLLQLYWKLDTHPEWLTGQGGDGSQHITALIEGLRKAGSRRVTADGLTSILRADSEDGLLSSRLVAA